MLPPGGGFPSLWSLIHTSYSLRNVKGTCSNKEILARAIQSSFASERAIITGSGKEALHLIAESFLNLWNVKNPVAGISAYTCPDVASALIRAGFRLKLFDVELETLNTDFSSSECDMIVMSNLYGFPDTFPSTQTFVVDDACQAGLSYLEGTRVGARGDAGILSFGRGKAFPGPGGGALLLNSQLELTRLPGSERKHFLRQGLKMLILWATQIPFVYRIPASLSFLKLGKTVIDNDFKMNPCPRGAALSGLVQIGSSKLRSEVFISNARKWAEALKDLNLVQPYVVRGGLAEVEDEFNSIVSIRYPIVFPNEELRDKAWIKLSKAGLGATCSYPGAISEYSKLSSFIESGSKDSNAKELAKRILTLPVHRYLMTDDINDACKIIKKVLV